MQAEKREKNYYFGIGFFRSLKVLFPLLYPGIEYAVLFTLMTGAAAGGYEKVNYDTGLMIGRFYQYLEEKDEHSFWVLFWKATGWYVCQCALNALTTLFGSGLYLAFRRNLTRYLHTNYFSNNVCYQLNTIEDEGIDNPDQRMTQDIEKFSNLLAVKVFPNILVAPFVIGYYTWRTWHTAGAVGVGVIYGYFFIGSILNTIVVQPLTKYKHVSVRDHAEGSAFYNAAKFEHSECDRIFHGLLYRQIIFISFKAPVVFLQQFLAYFGGVLTYAIQVIPIFWMHSYDDLKITEIINAFVYIYLINSFTKLTDVVSSVGEMAGYSQRISALVEYTQSSSLLANCFENEKPDKKPSKNTLEVHNLCYSSPSDGHVLIKDLNVVLDTRSNLLITGPSGIGKTSFYRILAKLWPKLSGKTQMNESAGVMFLPQKPYLPSGGLSLRQQLVFPSMGDRSIVSLIEDNKLTTILSELSLSHLVSMTGGLDEEPDFEWSERLSPGEAQRLSICRVLLHKPRLVFLDEATNSVPQDTERTIYRLLNENKIQYVSTGHQMTLRAFHDYELAIVNQDQHEIFQIDQDKF